MTEGVKQNEYGLWEVFVGNEMIARVSTNREAWDVYDRKIGDLRSKIEQTSDWIFNKSP